MTAAKVIVKNPPAISEITSKTLRHFLCCPPLFAALRFLSPLKFVLAMAGTILFGAAQAAEISANQEADKTIRVVVPEMFELTFTKRKGFVAAFFDLKHGPTHFQDILMVMQKGRYPGTYWNEGYRDKDVRTGLDLMSRWSDNTVPNGEDHIHLLMRFAHDLNSPDAAKPYAEDYRAPDRLAVSEGTIETADEGDRDADGFNEAEGCYVLKAGVRSVAFVLHGKNVPRRLPAFKIKGWTGPPPNSVALGQRELLRGKDVLASVWDGSLLVQILENVREDAKIEIPGRPR